MLIYINSSKNFKILNKKKKNKLLKNSNKLKKLKSKLLNGNKK